jgi:hypothetical protein
LVFATGCNLFAGIDPGPDDAGGTSDDAGLDAPETISDTAPADADDDDDVTVPVDDAGEDAALDMGGCVQESPLEFCVRLGKDCGLVDGTDNCGTSRLVDCGECADGADGECGETENNVCGCPCSIDGECWLVGQPNPDNPCEVCDPSRATDTFTIDVGAVCDDGDPCTADSTCDSAGECIASDVLGCEQEAGECQVGTCDEAARECLFEAAPDDTACGDDGLSCTADLCRAGSCDHVLMDDFCLIDDTCYPDGATDPANPCAACDVSVSTSDFTLTPGAVCDDGDGLSCTVGECSDQGACVSSLQVGNCLIANTCYASGATNPADDCEICDAGTATDQWVNAPLGSACDTGLACTTGVCSSGTCQQATIRMTSCLIEGTCYAAADTNPSNPCEFCDPTLSQTSWSTLADGTPCAGMPQCGCAVGVCVDNQGDVCP